MRRKSSKMKSLHALLVIGSFCLVAFLQNVECAIISTETSSNILNLTIISATLKPPIHALWYVLVYGLDSAKPLKLPINSTETQGITHVNYTTNHQRTLDTPTWNQSFLFSSSLFTEQSYIVLEVHGFHMVRWNPEYRYAGGTEFTIAQLRKFPKTVKLILSDQAGDSPGTIELSWQVNLVK